MRRRSSWRCWPASRRCSGVEAAEPSAAARPGRIACPRSSLSTRPDSLERRRRRSRAGRGHQIGRRDSRGDGGLGSSTSSVTGPPSWPLRLERAGRARRTSKSRTAAAMETFSDSARPAMGMVTAPSMLAASASGKPGASLPRTRARGASQIDLGCSRSPRGPRRPGRRSPAARQGHRGRSAGSPPATTGRWRTEPAEARTVFGLKGSTVPAQQTTASAPAASALLITAPALPGSRTSTQTTTKRGAGQVVEAGLPGAGRRPAAAGG